MIFNFHSIAQCTETISDRHVYIKDNESGVCEISDQNDFHLMAINKEGKDLYFTKIDKCLYDDSQGKRCDCSIADDNRIYFTEIKELLNAVDLNSTKEHSKRKTIRKNAKNQLISTIKDFKLKGLVDLRNTYAVIVLLPKLAEGYTKLITIKDQAVIADFMSKTGCPNIYEGNVIEF